MNLAHCRSASRAVVAALFVVLSATMACADGQGLTIPPSSLSKVVSTTKNLADASTSTAYTGFGFRPTSCEANWYINASPVYGSGFSDATLAGRSITFYASNSATGFNGLVSAFLPSAGTDFQVGSVASYDADGFTLSWVKTGVPTGTLSLNFICYR